MTPVPALLASVLCFSLMGVCVKSLGGRLPLSEVVLARSLISLAVSQAMLRRSGLSPWRPGWPLLALRGVFGTLALYALFAAYAWLPLAEVPVLQGHNTDIPALVAVCCLKQRPSPRIELARDLGGL
ncbi:MAG: EamA family transporter, partial [Cyanobacteriota bacterium]